MVKQGTSRDNEHKSTVEIFSLTLGNPTLDLLSCGEVQGCLMPSHVFLNNV